jgi:hypothetical protein
MSKSYSKSGNFTPHQMECHKQKTIYYKLVNVLFAFYTWLLNNFWNRLRKITIALQEELFFFSPIFSIHRLQIFL